MNAVEDVIITVATAVPSTGVIYAAGRKWLRRMVRDVVNDAVADLYDEFGVWLVGQRNHLNRQDVKLRELRELMKGDELWDSQTFRNPTLSPRSYPAHCRPLAYP